MARLSIIGAKNSGKTTLVEKLIPLLITAGFKVSSVKHTSHDHSFDKPGKDSHRHRTAGAKQTLVISSTEQALFGEYNSDIQTELIKLIENRSDICLVEGDKFSDSPKILLTHKLDQISAKEISNIIVTYGEAKTDLPVPHISLNDFEPLLEIIKDTNSINKIIGETYAKPS